MASSHGRIVQANNVVLDQVDFFSPDGFTRVQGLTTANVVAQLFFDNVLQPWPLTSGVNVSDAQIVSGKLYFNEVLGSPGFYAVRFRPTAIGYWRSVMTYPAGTQVMAQDFDVVQSVGGSAEGGLHASFVKPSGSGCC